MTKAVGSVGGATKSPKTSTRDRSLSRGAVFQKMAAQKMAASSSPPQRYIDLRGDLPNCSSITADENDDKRNFIRHLRIVAAAINADDTASAADREVSRRYQSYAASLDAALYMSLGEVVAKVVESDGLAGVFLEKRRKNTQKTNNLMATWRRVNKTSRGSIQVEFMKLKKENESVLKAPIKKPCRCARGAGALGRHINFELT